MEVGGYTAVTESVASPSDSPVSSVMIDSAKKQLIKQEAITSLGRNLAELVSLRSRRGGGNVACRKGAGGGSVEAGTAPKNCTALRIWDAERRPLKSWKRIA